MSLKINTNIAALNAHKNLTKTDNSLSSSLEKLSSGLRINKAADDASGMAIADSLRSQSLGLGQAIRNGNDAISIVQTADAALEESINIVNTIKTKSIQAAQDGQSSESRSAIQADITKLREELDNIAKTTSFNNQKLLSGNFTNKKFQIGAYAGETVDVSIQSTEANKIGHISTSNLTFTSEGTAELAVYSNARNETFNLNSVEVAYDNTRENSVGAVADAINILSDQLGITASASVTSTTTSSIAAGTTDDSFAVNGVKIGAISVSENDSTGALVSSINQKTDQHGIVASMDQGFLTLTSTDDRAIQVTQDANTTAVLGGTADMSTLGTISLTQQGTADISVSNRAGGAAIATLDNVIALTGVTVTTIDSELAAGSIIESGSTIAAGSVLSITTNAETSGDVTTTGTSVLGKGSVIQSGSIIGANSLLTGQLTASGVVVGTGDVGKGSTLAALSTIGAGTVLNTTANVTLNANITTTGSSVLTAGTKIEATSGKLAAGSIFSQLDLVSGNIAGGTVEVYSGNNYRVLTDVTLTNDITLTAEASLAGGSDLAATTTFATGSSIGKNFVSTNAITTSDVMTLKTGSSLTTDSIFQAGTKLNAALYVDATTTYTTTTGDMILEAGSKIDSGSTLADNSSLSNKWYNADQIDVTGNNMTLKAGSSLASGSALSEGSSIGAAITLAADETVDDTTDMRLAAGSSLATGSTITAGTYLTNDVVATDGVTYTAGSELTADIITAGNTDIVNTMTLNGGSIIKAGTVLAPNSVATDDAALGNTSAAESYRLSDIDVTTQEGAQIAISVADSALKNLDKIRSDLGSVQNQLTSTIANISTTKVNVQAAESTIRDVDFAEESANFTKMQILSQAGTFAMSQANASSQNVMSLLQ